jgi:hypothetical protein
MKIEVYKCRFTGTLFELGQKKEYIKHLKELRKNMKADREYQRIRNTFDKWLAEEKEKIVHVDMIAPWLLKNQQYLMKSCNAMDCHAWLSDNFFPATDEFTKIEMTARYSPSVSNTHSCPHNGVTNWGGRVKGAPTGYPGFKINVSGTLKRAKKHMSAYPYSAIFKLVRIHATAGGGGNENWSYCGEIFLADWPGLGQQLLADKLRGTE